MIRTFSIEGKPVPKPTQTQADKWQTRKCVVEYRDFADRLRGACAQVMTEPMEGPLRIKILIIVPRNTTHLKKFSQRFLHWCRPDLSNYVKAVEDALNNTAYKDDGQIVEISASKFVAAIDEPPSVTVTISEVTDEAYEYEKNKKPKKLKVYKAITG